MTIEYFFVSLYIFLAFMIFNSYLHLFLIFIEFFVPCPYDYKTYLNMTLLFIIGYIFNIYYGSNKWYLVDVEDMYMFVLSDIFSSKVIFIEKSKLNIKTQKISYNLETYTLMKRVKIPLTDKVKQVVKFIKDDE